MTISVKIEQAISAKAHGFRYVRSPDVAVVSVTGERDSPSTSLRMVTQACVNRFEPFLQRSRIALSHDRLLLLVATPVQEQPNALSRRRGIWGAANIGWLPGSAQRSPSVEIAEERGIRFAGLTQISTAYIFEASDFVRTRAGSFLSMSRDGDLTEVRVRLLTSKVFPEGSTAPDWASVVDQVGNCADICFRVSGGFDDREVSIDAFLPASLLPLLAAGVAAPDG